jgi:NAD(P)H-nitrite reductase large subunit
VSQLETSDHVIVVGAGLSGWRFVEWLRVQGFQGEITLVGEEAHAPYDRPPLSKQVLAGKWEVAKATLASPEVLGASDAVLRLGVRATSLDAARTSVTLSDDSLVEGTHVVIATGSRARPLSYPGVGPLPTLRSHDDVQALLSTLDTLAPGSVVVVIGGGFVGAEMATSLKYRGLVPIVLEVAARPLLSVVGEQASTWLAPLASDAGIELRVQQVVADVLKEDERYQVVFEDGSRLAASLVVAAIGSTLDVGWLEGSGLTLDNGVVVDDNLQGAHHVAAIGDVARFRWHSTVGEELVRIEHWQVAADHAAHLAHFWMTGETPTPMIPYFWSDQYGKKIQMLGHPHPDDDVHRVSGSPEEGKWLALYTRGDVVTGVIALSQPRGLMLAKPFLEATTTLDDALASAPWET